MKKHFYSDVVTLDTVIGEMAELDLSPEEKKELEEIAHDHLHETILDAILSELSARDKKIFLANIEYDTHEKVWKHLNEKVENVEDKIKAAAEKLKSELRDDIKHVKTSA
jgi:gas vesicle protein